jgi:hypothetical protein
MPPDVFANTSANWWEGGQKVKPGEKFQPRKLNTPLDKLARKHAGRRSLTKTERKPGRYIKARPAGEKRDDIAFDATFRAAAPHQKKRVEKRKKLAFAIESSDLQRKVRVKRVANLVLFLVDASWSMAVAERMNATKGAILSLLTDAYQRRDRVGLIVFQKDRATLVLPPTNFRTIWRNAPDGYSRRRKDSALRRAIPCGGCTAPGENPSSRYRTAAHRAYRWSRKRFDWRVAASRRIL